MKNLGRKNQWGSLFGNFSEVLRYIVTEYPDILFERPDYGFCVILNIPYEYDINKVTEYIKKEYEEKYHICTFNELARLIVITV